MKRSFKNLIVCLIICFSFIISGCSCSEKEKTYSGHGMSITMVEGFHEKTLVSATYYLESEEAIMIALKEEFQLALPEETTLNEYANLVLDNNMLEASIETRENEDYLYFIYEKTVSGKDFFYLATTHKTENSFWLIQFACEEDDKEEYEDKFLDWADTITFEVEE